MNLETAIGILKLVKTFNFTPRLNEAIDTVLQALCEREAA